ncbi:HipA domain-containing protein [Methanolapillus millepedarum]|uniref:HipA-like C-terminal domain-containing protein n=1 Tax=Methanolapillus millepedarum TaxID=3028296 RepID=A0AA96V1R1_9EURY|nr:hypothetical protein MsAc7_01480 [Methanosarcinaceae archaeon Ac7]
MKESEPMVSEVKRCLYCYKDLSKNEIEKNMDFHPSCSKKIFETTQEPVLPYHKYEIDALALEVVRSQTTITGVQPKLSLNILNETPKRFTIVGLWGRYILKPPADAYLHLPETEDLTMHLAEVSGLPTVPHSLIRFKGGELCYITKRIDRDKNGNKRHMEDMCQLTERLTENKYKGSYEQIGKTIVSYSSLPGLDLIRLMEQVLFCFLTGNADMHLKNFSLIKENKTDYVLAPAYDMIATKLILSEDLDELALTLNGRKRKIDRGDFEAAFQTLKLDEKTGKNIFNKFETTIPLWTDWIHRSFLPEEMKEKYLEMVLERANRMNLVAD